MTAVRLFVQDSGSTSIQAADSTAINGSITPTDKRYCTPSLQNIFLIITSEMYLKADQKLSCCKCFLDFSFDHTET